MKVVIIENNILATNTIRKKLAVTLLQKGFEVVVLTTGEVSELEKARSEGLRVIDVQSGGGNLLEVGRYIWNLNKSLSSIKPDIILTFTMRPNIWGNIIAGIKGIRVVSNITGTGQLFSSKNISFRIARLLYKFALRKTDWIFFQNIEDQKLFVDRKMVNEKKTSIIPGSGVDTTFFAPMNKPEQTPFTFLFIGRLIKDKGIVEFVKAAVHLKRLYPEVVFKIVGPLWKQNIKSNTISKEELDFWIKSKIVKYAGNDTDVRSFIAASDCVVLPSYREGMSNVLLEAGSMEKPCIATNVTGCKEIIVDKETGLLCKPKDADDLAGKMIEMFHISAQVRKDMGKTSRLRAQKYFEKNIVIQEYLDVIEKVI